MVGGGRALNSISLQELTRQQVSSLDQPLMDIPGWDSLKMVRLVLRIEDALDRQLEESEVEKLESVADIQNLLDGK
jgi:acyl carrier protein